MKLKEPKESQDQRQQRTKSALEILHQIYKTLNSKNLQKEFQLNPEKFYEYHDCSEENRYRPVFRWLDSFYIFRISFSLFVFPNSTDDYRNLASHRWLAT